MKDPKPPLSCPPDTAGDLSGERQTCKIHNYIHIYIYINHTLRIIGRQNKKVTFDKYLKLPWVHGPHNHLEAEIFGLSGDFKQPDVQNVDKIRKQLDSQEEEIAIPVDSLCDPLWCRFLLMPVITIPSIFFKRYISNTIVGVAQDTPKRARQIIRMNWENYDAEDLRLKYVGARDTEGFWIKCAVCETKLVCRNYFRYRLLRLSAHISAVHDQERMEAANSYKLDKWFRLACKTDAESGSDDTFKVSQIHQHIKMFKTI